jgi:hypothetical protein
MTQKSLNFWYVTLTKKKDWLKVNYLDKPNEITNENIHRFLSEIQYRPHKKKGRKRKIISVDEGEEEVAHSSPTQQPPSLNQNSVEELLVPTPEVPTCGYSTLEQYSNAIVSSFGNYYFFLL